MEQPTDRPVLRFADCPQHHLLHLLDALGLELEHVADGQPIPGSFWGDDEAGLIGNSIYVRDDTPVHSLLHEACHFACMDDSRRATLHTNAGGTHQEENAVCYLQILLADALPEFGRARMCRDMDAWGYSFRLGSAAAWFERDADDAHTWLERRGLLAFAAEATDRLTHLHGAAGDQ